MANTQRPTLIRLGDADLTVADSSQDIRGRDVFDRAGDKIGSVDGLLIDDREARVRFMEIGSGGFLGIGKSKVLIPIDAIARIDDKHVHIDKTREHIAGSPTYDPALVDDGYYDSVYGYYGYAPYWSAGYMYPMLPYYPHA